MRIAPKFFFWNDTRSVRIAAAHAVPPTPRRPPLRQPRIAAQAMAETAAPPKDLEDLQEDLREVRDLLRRHRLVEGLVARQETPKRERVESPVHEQNVAELGAKLDRMHPADIAYILEALPREERLVVWDLVKAERDGEILLEVSDSVRESLIASMDAH